MTSLTGRLIERMFYALTTSRSLVSPNVRACCGTWPRKDFPNGDRRLEGVESHRLRLAGRLAQRHGALDVREMPVVKRCLEGRSSCRAAISWRRRLPLGPPFPTLSHPSITALPTITPVGSTASGRISLMCSANRAGSLASRASRASGADRGLRARNAGGYCNTTHSLSLVTILPVLSRV